MSWAASSGVEAVPLLADVGVGGAGASRQPEEQVAGIVVAQLEGVGQEVADAHFEAAFGVPVAQGAVGVRLQVGWLHCYFIIHVQALSAEPMSRIYGLVQLHDAHQRVGFVVVQRQRVALVRDYGYPYCAPHGGDGAAQGLLQGGA